MAGEGPIPFVEIDAWDRLNKIKISPAELGVIIRLDREYLRRNNEEEQEPISIVKALHAAKAAIDADKNPKTKTVKVNG